MKLIQIKGATGTGKTTALQALATAFTVEVTTAEAVDVEATNATWRPVTTLCIDDSSKRAVRLALWAIKQHYAGAVYERLTVYYTVDKEVDLRSKPKKAQAAA